MRCSKIARLVGYFVVVLVSIELGVRTYLALAKRIPFFSTSIFLFVRYPELKDVDLRTDRAGRNCFEILFLGGSTLNQRWGKVQVFLEERLGSALPRPVHITNVTMGAHSSLDDYYKYDYLRKKRFDLVVYYNAINEVRANNCPPEMYREDYSHYSYYDDLNRWWRHKELGYSAVTYVLYQSYLSVRRLAHPRDYLPRNEPRAEWTAYGSQVKTEAAYRMNVRRILEIARQKKERVFLCTLAYYVPDNYTRENFQEKKLDYVAHIVAVELWGLPGNVIKGILVHNNVLRELARDYPDECCLVDFERMMPKKGMYFADICHLSNAGSRVFADLLAQAILTESQGTCASVKQ